MVSLLKLLNQELKMKLKINKIYLLIVLVIFSLIKIDYRFDEIPYGLEVDDAEYYYSATTIGLDFDLDFSNQMNGIENRFLNAETNKIVPFHPIGSGLLASPFVVIGNLMSKLFKDDGLISFVYFTYSIAPIFYLFVSIKLLQSTLQNLKIKYVNNLLLIMIFGTGISYYAFDRFSMSHVYEFFSIALLAYLTSKLEYLKNKNTESKYMFLIGFFIFVLLTIRWINYFLFLIPGLIYLLSNRPMKKIYTNLYFLLGCFVGVVLFLAQSKYLYGIYSFNQSNIVLLVENSFEENYQRFFDLSQISDNLLFVMKSTNIILFSNEFGLFFFAPIIFISLLIFFLLLYKRKFLECMFILFIYFFPLFSIIVVQNTAFSYGFRYLFVLIPVNAILYFKYLHTSNFIRWYITVFSLLGFVLYIFFETNQATSLSENYLINSFGMNTRYSNPEYLTNLPTAIRSFDSYAHIIFTSFFGVLIIKFIGLLTDPIQFFNNFTELSPEVSELIYNSLNFSWLKLSIIYISVFLLVNSIYKEIDLR